MPGKDAPGSGVSYLFPKTYPLRPTTAHFFPCRDPLLPAIFHGPTTRPVKNTEQMLEEAKRLEPDPPRSKLDDYAEIIWELRHKRKRICAIADFLVARGVRVGKSTVARWLKTHPAPKSDAATRRIPSVSPTSEAKHHANEFFTPTTDSNHETTRKYNIG